LCARRILPDLKWRKGLPNSWVLARSLSQVLVWNLEASSVRPEAIATMADAGIDISQQTSNALAEFKPDDFDVVISLCGCGYSLPPEWLQREIFDDWQLDDPAEKPEIFPQVRDQVRERVERLLESIASKD
jgi:arsenate reductase (thioredoxin)